MPPANRTAAENAQRKKKQRADEAEKAVLEGCGISSVISEDLSFFRKLTHLDLGGMARLSDIALQKLLARLRSPTTMM